MSNILYKLGKQNVLNKQIAITSDTIKATLLTMSSAAGKIYLITNATNATPIVATVASTTGITAGDILVVGGVGGNLAANGTWTAGTVTGTTVQLLTVPDSNNSTGSGAYTAGGWIIDISSGSVLADVSANSNGTDVTLTGVTNTLGTVNSNAWSWTGLSATKSWAITLYDTTASNDLIAWIDGTWQVYIITQAASTSTSLATTRFAAVIPNGNVLTFSDGAAATMTAQANVGDTSLTVSSTAATIHRQATADTPTNASGLPVTPASGGGLTFTPDSGVNKLFTI